LTLATRWFFAGDSGDLVIFSPLMRSRPRNQRVWDGFAGLSAEFFHRNGTKFLSPKYRRVQFWCMPVAKY
jgi:hypothetical protein